MSSTGVVLEKILNFRLNFLNEIKNVVLLSKSFEFIEIGKNNNLV